MFVPRSNVIDHKRVFTSDLTEMPRLIEYPPGNLLALRFVCLGRSTRGTILPVKPEQSNTTIQPAVISFVLM